MLITSPYEECISVQVSFGEKHSHHFFPFVSTDHRHSRDMIGVFLEETHLVPTCFPIRTLHLREIREHPDRPRLPFIDEKCNLRLKRRDFIAANPSDNLEPESSFLLSLSLSIIAAILL
jgi:hypothetical protein